MVQFSIIILLFLALVGGMIYLLVRAFSNKTAKTEAIEGTDTGLNHKIPSVKNTPLAKAITIGVLCVLALIPMGIVMDMTSDRESLYHEVVRDIGRSWGEDLTLSGPVLVIPYSYYVMREESSDDGKTINQIKEINQDELIILPKKLELNLSLKHDFRSRGIYQSLVYNAALQGKADFSPSQYKIPNLIAFDHNNARLVFGISSNKAIDKVEAITLRGDRAQLVGSLMSGTDSTDIDSLKKGFYQGIALADEHNGFSVDFAMTLRGSQSIDTLPLGEQTLVNIEADWPHPSFNGVLPSQRQIDEHGFKAQWNISHLTRNYPQEFVKSRGAKLSEITANTTLFEPVTHYGKVERSVKYGLLFIVLTFIMLFIFELGQKANLSSIQYMLVGAAMAIFYLLLLSLSEHLSFIYAYLIAATIPVLSISAYVASATRSPKRGVTVGVMQAGLYTVLYSILQLEDYALLMGTGLLLIVLLILMYVTRHHNPHSAD